MGRSKSASRALQYKVVSIVCAGPLRSTETLSVTCLSLNARDPRWATDTAEVRIRSCDDGYQRRPRRKTAAGFAAVLHVHGTVVQSPRGRGRGVPRARVRGAEGPNRIHGSAVCRTVLALPDATCLA